MAEINHRELVTLWVGNDSVAPTIFGFVDGSIGTMFPANVWDAYFKYFRVDTADDSVTIVLNEAVVLSQTKIGVSFSNDGSPLLLDLTTADNLTYTAIDAGITTLVSEAVDTALVMFVELIETSDAINSGVQVDTECVRVGEEPANSVAYPALRGGWDNADVSYVDYPDAGTTNEVGGGCR